MKYLTNTQYTNLDEGLTVNMTPLALAQLIAKAEAAIDGYMGFDKKTGGFEPGNRYAQSAWDQESRRTPFPNPMLPVRTVASYQIQVSNLNNNNNTEQGFFAEIQPSDVAINNYQRYFEIVPLQAITYSVFPGIMDFGLVPPIVNVNCEQGFYLPVFGETLIDSGDHTTYWALRGFWASTYDQSQATQPTPLPPVPQQLYKNGNPISTGFYTANMVDGSVTFSSANQPADSVTLDYTYQIPDEVKFAAVAQTTYLLQRRAMNQLNIFPDLIQRVRNADQEIQTPTKSLPDPNFLCLEAQQMLDKAFNLIPIG